MPDHIGNFAQRHADFAHIAFEGAFSKVRLQRLVYLPFRVLNGVIERLQSANAIGRVESNAALEKPFLSLQRFVEIGFSLFVHGKALVVGNFEIHHFQLLFRHQFGYGIERVCLRVRESRKFGDVFRTNPAQRTGNPHTFVKLLYTADKFLRGAFKIPAGIRDARFYRQRGESERGVQTVFFEKIRQNDGVCQAVRNIVLSAQRVRHGVHVAHIRLGKGDAREIGGALHSLPRFCVLSVRIGAGQISENQPHGFLRSGARFPRGRIADISFHGVRQGVHARRRRKKGRQGKGDFLIEKRIPRNQAKSVDRVFVPSRVVGDDRGERRFASRAGGRGNGDEKRQPTENMQDALHLRQRLFRIHRARPRRLRTVHRGAASERDDGFAFVQLIHGMRLFHVGNGGIRHGILIDEYVYVFFRAYAFKLFRQPRGVNPRVRNEQHFVRACLFENVCRFGNGMQDLRTSIRQKRDGEPEHGLIGTAIQPPQKGHFRNGLFLLRQPVGRHRQNGNRQQKLRGIIKREAKPVEKPSPASELVKDQHQIGEIEEQRSEKDEAPHPFVENRRGGDGKRFAEHTGNHDGIGVYDDFQALKIETAIETEQTKRQRRHGEKCREASERKALQRTERREKQDVSQSEKRRADGKIEIEHNVARAGERLPQKEQTAIGNAALFFVPCLGKADVEHTAKQEEHTGDGF